MNMKDLKSFCVYDVPDVNLHNTGKILKNLRIKNNLSVRDLQEFFRFEYPNAIYDWEKGLKLPNMSNLIALSTLYEVSIDDILLSNEQDFYFYIDLSYEIIAKKVHCFCTHNVVQCLQTIMEVIL